MKHLRQTRISSNAANGVSSRRALAAFLLALLFAATPAPRAVAQVRPADAQGRPQPSQQQSEKRKDSPFEEDKDEGESESESERDRKSVV